MNMQEIDDEIAKLEHSDTTWHNCEKLSVLYGVKNGIHKANTEAPVEQTKIAYSYASSEFMAAVQGKDPDAVLRVLDEHMEVVQVLFPKEHDAVIRKIKNLS